MFGRKCITAALVLGLVGCGTGPVATANKPTMTNAPNLGSPPPIVAGVAGPSGTPGFACAVSPDSTFEANGYVLTGKSDGNIFIYPAAGRVFAANRPEKLLVFLDPLPAVLPSPLIVHGRNRTSGTTAVFENTRHLSDYGTEWGLNYRFPDAGCWELWVADPAIRGNIILLVMP